MSSSFAEKLERKTVVDIKIKCIELALENKPTDYTIVVKVAQAYFDFITKDVKDT